RHESKATGSTGRAIHHQVGLGDRAMRGERVLQVVFSGVEGKVSHKQFITHFRILLSDKPALSTDCSRPSGLKSSLNQVHLKIHHALKETSYLIDVHSFTHSRQSASLFFR